MKKRNKFQVLNPAQQGLLGIIKEKLQYLFEEGACNLEPVQSTHGWAMSGIIKVLNISFQGERKKKKRFQLYTILEKAKLWRQ